MNKKLKILIFLSVIIFGFLIGRDFFIKSVIAATASRICGAPVEIGRLSLSLIGQQIRISDLRMYNPKGFPEGILLDIPQIAAAWDTNVFFKGKIHLRQLDLEIREIGMIKNNEGKLNIDSLKIVESKPAKGGELSMQLDLVNLAIGRVVDKNYDLKGPALVKVYDVNLKKSYRNIRSFEQLAVLIITEPLKSAGIKGIKVYSVAMLSGVAVLPVAAAFTLIGKDFTSETIAVSFEKAYAAGLAALKNAGSLKNENKEAGIISANIKGALVVLKLRKISDKSTWVTVSARRFFIPRPEIASGILYQMIEQLK